MGQGQSLAPIVKGSRSRGPHHTKDLGFQSRLMLGGGQSWEVGNQVAVNQKINPSVSFPNIFIVLRMMIVVA